MQEVVQAVRRGAGQDADVGGQSPVVVRPGAAGNLEGADQEVGADARHPQNLSGTTAQAQQPRSIRSNSSSARAYMKPNTTLASVGP